MQTDPIADFLTRLRNAAAAKHQRVDVPVSKLKTDIARILKEEGYISTYKLVDENKTRKMLRFPEVHAGPPQRDHRAEAHLAPGSAIVSRRDGHPSRGVRTGKQHHDHADGADERPPRALHGLARALVANAVHGVTSGFKKELDIVGVGYRAELKGKMIAFALGKSHPIEFPIPEGIQVAVEKQTHLIVSGADKGQVGQ